MTQKNEQFVPPAPGQQLPTPPPEVLDGITFNDKPSVIPEQKPAEPVVPPTPPAPEKKETPAVPEIKVDKATVLPSRFEGESDVQYNLRTKLFITGQAKAKAETPEEKSLIAQEMSRIRDELAKVNKEQQPPTPPSKPNTPPAPADDREAILNSLKELGFKPGDEVTKEAEAIAKKIVEERFNSEQMNARRSEQTSAITDFYTTRDDIFSDDAKRTVLETYVLEMFKPQLPNMNKAQLMQALDMAANYLFPRDAINRKIDDAQDKTDKLNIHGSQGGDIKPSTVTDKSKAELRAIGWSEEDIESFEKKK